MFGRRRLSLDGRLQITYRVAGLPMGEPMCYAFLPFMVVGSLMDHYQVPGAAAVIVVGLCVSGYVGWILWKKN